MSKSCSSVSPSMTGADFPPKVVCRKLAAFDPEDWESIAAAFSGAEACVLRQSWRRDPEPGFRPGCVRTGWSDGALLAYAELEDEDIFNPVTEMNAPSYKHGDVFEIFLRPPEQQAYYEIHVTPRNQRLQLRIPSAEEIGRLRAHHGEIPEAWLIPDGGIETRVEVRAGQRNWRIFARIPFRRVAEVRDPDDGTEWLFSFSRYDYTKGKTKPVLSSSSPHRLVDFHRQQEWGSLRFCTSETAFMKTV